MTDGTEEISKAVRLTLFRIAQEALKNAARHSKATEVLLSVSLTDDQICLVIQDDGVGMAQAGTGMAQGLGLLSMEERARFLGGQLTVQSAGATGTRVAATIPIKGR